jgi:hypothetical protein
MNHKGIDFTVSPTAAPGVWKWQFQIGQIVRTGKTEARLNLLARRRVQLRIDKALKEQARARADV